MESEAYLETSQTPTMELFTKVLNGYKYVANYSCFHNNSCFSGCLLFEINVKILLKHV